MHFLFLCLRFLVKNSVYRVFNVLNAFMRLFFWDFSNISEVSSKMLTNISQIGKTYATRLVFNEVCFIFLYN